MHWLFSDCFSFDFIPFPVKWIICVRLGKIASICLTKPACHYQYMIDQSLTYEQIEPGLFTFYMAQSSGDHGSPKLESIVSFNNHGRNPWNVANPPACSQPGQLEPPDDTERVQKLSTFLGKCVAGLGAKKPVQFIRCEPAHTADRFQPELSERSTDKSQRLKERADGVTVQSEDKVSIKEQNKDGRQKMRNKKHFSQGYEPSTYIHHLKQSNQGYNKAVIRQSKPESTSSSMGKPKGERLFVMHEKSKGVVPINYNAILFTQMQNENEYKSSLASLTGPSSKNSKAVSMKKQKKQAMSVQKLSNYSKVSHNNDRFQQAIPDAAANFRNSAAVAEAAHKNRSKQSSWGSLAHSESIGRFVKGGEVYRLPQCQIEIARKQIKGLPEIYYQNPAIKQSLEDLPKQALYMRQNTFDLRVQQDQMKRKKRLQIIYSGNKSNVVLPPLSKVDLNQRIERIQNEYLLGGGQGKQVPRINVAEVKYDRILPGYRERQNIIVARLKQVQKQNQMPQKLAGQPQRQILKLQRPPI